MEANRVMRFVCGVLVTQGIVVTCVNGCDFLCVSCGKNQQIEPEKKKKKNDGKENGENEDKKETENKGTKNDGKEEGENENKKKNEDESKKETKPKCPLCNSTEVSNERELCKKCCKGVRCHQHEAGGYRACVSNKNLMMRECGCIVCGDCYSNNKYETCTKCGRSFCSSFACKEHARCNKCKKIFCLNDWDDRKLVNSIVGYLDEKNVNIFMRKISFICNECYGDEKCCYQHEGEVCTRNARFLLSCGAKNHFFCDDHFGKGDNHVKCCLKFNSKKGKFDVFGGHWLCRICLLSDKNNHTKCNYDKCRKIICGGFRENMIDGKYCSQECRNKDTNSGSSDSE